MTDFPSSLPIPDEVLDIARTLEGAGFETWCVGGIVRDNLLGLKASNEQVDLATAATPAQVQALFRKTIPIGIEHGTVAVLDRNRKPHEVTTFRRDVKTDGRHAVVEFGVALEDDLARRDFTINAIAYHPLRHEWRDPHQGSADLAARVIRAVGDPASRFREDYLRTLRAARFAARFDFAIEPATFAAAQASADGLPMLSAERVRDEWFKGLIGARRPSQLVRLWDELGALRLWLPEIPAPLDGNRTGVLERITPRDPVLLTIWLSTDPAMTLARLRCSNAEIERGRAIGEFRAARPDAASPVAVRRWLARVGSSADDLIALETAQGTDPALGPAVDAERQSGAALGLSGLAIGGRDVIALGVPQGPEVGKVLHALMDEVLEDPSRNNPDYLRERINALKPS